MPLLVHGTEESFAEPTTGTAANAANDGLMLGEIRTTLLSNSAPVRPETADQLLALGPQQRVRRWERPVRHAASPEVLTGVDCQMPSAASRKLRGVGTIVTDVRITGGQVVQGASRVLLVPATESRRRSWSHYLTQPGTIETWARPRVADVVQGFFHKTARREALDLSGPTAHRLNTVQASALLNGRPALRPQPIRLRWVAVATQGAPSVRFSLEETAEVHTLHLEVHPDVLAGVPELCRDIALHDWLLSSVLDLLDRADIGDSDRERGEVIKTLAPGIDHLLHTWMPRARIGEELMEHWHEFDRRSGLTRQWEAAVHRIRDQLALATVELAAVGRPPLAQIVLPERMLPAAVEETS